jgi:hypothetical protein
MTVSSIPTGGLGNCGCSTTGSTTSTTTFPTASTLATTIPNYALTSAEIAMIQQAILAASNPCQPGGVQSSCVTVGGNTPMTFTSGVGAVNVISGGLNYFQDSPMAVIVPPSFYPAAPVWNRRCSYINN